MDLISLSLGGYPIRFVTNRLSCIHTYQSDYNSNDIGIAEDIKFPPCSAGKCQSQLSRTNIPFQLNSNSQIHHVQTDCARQLLS